MPWIIGIVNAVLASLWGLDYLLTNLFPAYPTTILYGAFSMFRFFCGHFLGPIFFVSVFGVGAALVQIVRDADRRQNFYAILMIIPMLIFSAYIVLFTTY